ncbi:hypothetical protein MBLNU457_1427t1 [Dothideomycetes sp. NU457]
MALKRKASAESTVPHKHFKSLATQPQKSIAVTERSATSRTKRAHVTQEDSKSSHPKTASTAHSGTKEKLSNKPQAVKRRREDQTLETPQNKRFKDALPPTPTDTPTKGARNLFDNLKLAATTKVPSTPAKTKVVLQSPPLTPESIEDVTPLPPLESLPTSAQDLTSLFSAFVNATSIFMAHNGSHSPVHLSELLPLVTGSWKKRGVVKEDIQRLLGVYGHDQAPFTLSDDGEGRIALEKTSASAALLCLNAQALNTRFEERLRRLWRDWTSKSDAHTTNHLKFFSSLPLVVIEASELAVDSSKPNKKRVQLSNLKRDIVESRAQEVVAKKPTVAPNQKSTQAVSSRGSSLLDRIIAKQQLLSTRPSGPTREEIDRNAALDRVEDVIRVMDLLATGRPRVSFSMQMMIQHLQSSLRSPISREEAERCIDLMAGEIVPSFVSLIKTGSVSGVVVMSRGKVNAVELRRRLQAAGASQ